jgi:dolichol-phosphate mannosyltransferase
METIRIALKTCRIFEKLEDGYDFMQGSWFINGGRAVNTPLIRTISVKIIHAPIISLTAYHRFTDTTNAYRAYSARYLLVRATQIGYKACEIPVSRVYPRTGKTPTKISFFKGNSELLVILFRNLIGAYMP